MKDSLRLSAMQLAGGISKRPPHLRTPGQLEDAQNLVFSVVDGINKRPGTKLDRGPGGTEMAPDARAMRA